MRFVADTGSRPVRYNPLLGGQATGLLIVIIVNVDF